MKRVFLTVALTLIMGVQFMYSQSVGVNNDGSTPDPSAILDVKSTTKGMLVPRMTVVQAFAIPGPEEGLLVYGTDVQSFLYYKSGTWNYLTSEFAYEIADFDFDTRVTTGGVWDDDTIRCYVKNAEVLRIDSTHIVPLSANIFIGKNTGANIIPGEGNIAIGHNTLMVNNQSGIVAIGDSALSVNYDDGDPVFYQGEQNTAVGTKALKNNFTGSFNTAMGYEALKYNSKGFANTAVGTKALYLNNYSGFSNESFNNTALGAFALQDNNTGKYNNGMGSNALWHNSTGDENCAVGSNSMLYNYSGNTNCAFGNHSLQNNYSGHSNVAIGFAALLLNSSGSNSVAVGDSSLFNNQVSGNVAVGSKALFANTTGTDNTALGHTALYSITTGSSNIAIGNSALYSDSDHSFLIAIGDSALFHNGIGGDWFEGTRNIAIGYKTQFNNTTGSDNVATGHFSMQNNTTGSSNSAYGRSALSNNSTGSNNIAVGLDALYHNTSGICNIGIGDSTLQANTSGSYNIAIGNQALWNNLTSTNVAIGSKALYINSVGYSNTALGTQALYSSTGNTNTAVGNWALHNLTDGYGNTAIGESCWPYGTTAYSNYTGIGYYVGTGVADPSNRVEIGNTSVGWIGGQMGWSTYSDARIKDNIRQDVPGLDFVMKLKPVTYNLNIHKQNQMMYDGKETEGWPGKYDIEQKRMTGFLAQDVAKAAEETHFDFSGVDIPENDNDLYSLRYAEFVVPLVKAVQEQHQTIEQLTQENQELKARLDRIEELIGN